MKKQYLALLAAGCVAANAADVNYDLLGRKSSKMNSPMVYKNVDYSKVKSNEEQTIGSSLVNRALAKTGMPDNVKAIQGAFFTNRSVDAWVGTSHTLEDGHFFLKKYNQNGPENCKNEKKCFYDWSGYKNALNKIFIKTNEDRNTTPNYETAASSNSESAGYTYYDLIPINDNLQQPSPYPMQAGEIIQYTPLYNVVRNNSASNYVYNWLANQKSDVGIYMDAGALPADIKPKENIKYVKVSNNSSFDPTPGYEMDATRTYKVLKRTSENYNSVIYVGKGYLDNPSSKVPQAYIGVRNKHETAGLQYSSTAKKLDNYIYENRTIEFAAAGDYGAHASGAKPKMNAYAYAANAITVGAYDPISESILTYSSTANNVGTVYTGSQKPEVYNYSNVSTLDYVRTYTNTSNGKKTEYRALFDGTRIAAAYTAGMVANLLAVNPFYRWHPEVVKAMLLTQDRNTPSYPYLVFDIDNHDRYDHESRYWNGDINSLKTRTYNNQHEIWFVTRNMGSAKKPSTAAISWLSSGNDISKIGHIPQNFDLYVYGSNNSDYECFDEPYMNLSESVSCHGKSINFNFDQHGVHIKNSKSVYSSYEKVKIASNYDYLIFKIVLKEEDSTSENKGQIVLGFNMSSPDQYR